MDNNITTTAFSIHNNKGIFALLLGSGISRNSGIPTGWEITCDLIGKVAIMKGHERPSNPEAWYRQTFNIDPDYSAILEILTNTASERVNVLRSYIEPSAEELENGLKVPTIAHRHIAQLVKGGFIKVIVTTNFDRLMENALAEVGIEAVVVSNPKHIQHITPLIHNQITVLKINGDYLDTNFLNIKSELISYDPDLTNLLHLIFENFGILTCGWSARWDIALVEILKSSNKFRYGNYYTYISSPDQYLTDLSNIRTGKLLSIRGADEFFTELVELIKALDELDGRHPLTPKLAITRLKKYLSKEEFIIPFNDLIQDVTEDCYKKVYSLSHASFKEILSQYQLHTSLLCQLALYGSFWGREMHENIILRSLTRVFYQSNSNKLSWEISRVPILMLRYACGIACVANHNYGLLKRLLELKVRKDVFSYYLTDITNQHNVLDKRRMQTEFNNTYIMPQSEFLFTFLRPLFSELLPDDEDFKTKFQLYELYTSLYHFGQDRMFGHPVGTYTIGYTPIAYNAIDEMIAQGNETPVIKLGLFKDVTELERTYKSYKETIKDMYQRY